MKLVRKGNLLIISRRLAQRLRRSQELLETTDHSIGTVSSLAGYRSPVSFRQSFTARFNVSPSEWRRTCRSSGLVKTRAGRYCCSPLPADYLFIILSHEPASLNRAALLRAQFRTQT